MPVVDQSYEPQFAIDALLPHPKNPRKHDQESIDTAIDTLGFNGAILVQAGTGFILDGHGRVDSLRRQGATSVPAFVLDVDDAQAEKIMLARNRVGEKSGYDADLLGSLLQELAESDDLLGTGYNADDVDDLFVQYDEAAETPAEEFTGDYAEQSAQTEQRQKRETAVRHNIGLREMVLVFTDEDYTQLTQALGVVSDFASTQSASASVLHAVVNYAKELVADVTGV